MKYFKCFEENDVDEIKFDFGIKVENEAEIEFDIENNNKETIEFSEEVEKPIIPQTGVNQTKVTHINRHFLYQLLKRFGYHPYATHGGCKGYEKDNSNKSIMYYFDEVINSWSILFKDKNQLLPFYKYANQKFKAFSPTVELLPKKHEFNYILSIHIGRS